MPAEEIRRAQVQVQVQVETNKQTRAWQYDLEEGETIPDMLRRAAVDQEEFGI